MPCLTFRCGLSAGMHAGMWCSLLVSAESDLLPGLYSPVRGEAGQATRCHRNGGYHGGRHCFDCPAGTLRSPISVLVVASKPSGVFRPAPPCCSVLADQAAATARPAGLHRRPAARGTARRSHHRSGQPCRRCRRARCISRSGCGDLLHSCRCDSSKHHYI